MIASVLRVDTHYTSTHAASGGSTFFLLARDLWNRMCDRTTASSTANPTKTQARCFAITAETMLTIPGPNFTTRNPKMRNLITRPAKIDKRNRYGRISNTPAPSRNNLNGVGGGSIAGIIMAKNSRDAPSAHEIGRAHV